MPFSNPESETSPKTILVKKPKSNSKKKSRKISFALDQPNEGNIFNFDYESLEIKDPHDVEDQNQNFIKNEDQSVSAFPSEMGPMFQAQVKDVLEFYEYPSVNNANIVESTSEFGDESLEQSEEMITEKQKKPKVPIKRKTGSVKSKSNGGNPKSQKNILENNLKSLQLLDSMSPDSNLNLKLKKVKLISVIQSSSSLSIVTPSRNNSDIGLSKASSGIGIKKSPYLFPQCQCYPTSSSNIFTSKSKSFPIPLALKFPQPKILSDKGIRTRSASTGSSKIAVTGIDVQSELKKQKQLRSSSASLQNPLNTSSKARKIVNEQKPKRKIKKSLVLPKKQQSKMTMTTEVDNENLKSTPTKLKSKRVHALVVPSPVKKIIKNKANKNYTAQNDDNIIDKILAPVSACKNYSKEIIVQDYDKFISRFNLESELRPTSTNSSASSLLEEQRLESVFQEFLSSFKSELDSNSSVSSEPNHAQKVSSSKSETENKNTSIGIENKMLQVSELEAYSAKLKQVENWLKNNSSPCSSPVPEKNLLDNNSNVDDKEKQLQVVQYSNDRPPTPGTLSFTSFEPLIKWKSQIRNISIAKPIYRGPAHHRLQVISNCAHPLFKCDNNNRGCQVSKSVQNIDLNFIKSVISSLSNESLPVKYSEASSTRNKNLQIIPFPRILPNQNSIVDENDIMNTDDIKLEAIANAFFHISKSELKSPKPEIPQPEPTEDEPKLQTKLYNIAHNVLTQMESAITSSMSSYYDDFIDNCLGEYIFSKSTKSEPVISKVAKIQSYDLSDKDEEYDEAQTKSEPDISKIARAQSYNLFDTDEDEEYEEAVPKFKVLFEKPLPPNLVPVLRTSNKIRKRRSKNRVTFSPGTKDEFKGMESGTETETDYDGSDYDVDYDYESSASDLTKYINLDDLLPKSLNPDPKHDTEASQSDTITITPFLPISINEDTDAGNNNENEEKEAEEVEKNIPKTYCSMFRAFKNPLQNEFISVDDLSESGINDNGPDKTESESSFQTIEAENESACSLPTIEAENESASSLPTSDAETENEYESSLQTIEAENESSLQTIEAENESSLQTIEAENESSLQTIEAKTESDSNLPTTDTEAENESKSNLSTIEEEDESNLSTTEEGKEPESSLPTIELEDAEHFESTMESIPVLSASVVKIDENLILD